MATALDPRFKHRLFPLDSSVAALRQMMIEEVEQLMDPINTKDTTPSSGQVQVCNQADKIKSTLWSMIDNMVQEEEPTDGMHSNAVRKSPESIVDDYLHAPLVSRQSDPLEYWKDKATVYPLLSTIARKYLSIPPTSVPSERLFSTSGLILTDLRNRLSADKVEQLLLLNKNLRLFDFNYVD